MELVIRGKKKVYKTTKDTGELERELKGFLEGERLPLGIVASEVLGPPRSKRSYSRRKT